MKCGVILLAFMIAAITAAHAQVPAANNTMTGDAKDQTGQPPSIEVPLASPQVPQTVQGQPDVVSAQPPVTTDAAVAPTAPNRQTMMRELQDKGREATMRARELQATNPVAAQKVMKDYYQMRQDKMKELRETERAQAVQKRELKREQAQSKGTRQQVDGAAVRPDTQNTRESQDRQHEKSRHRRAGQTTR